MIFRNRKPNFDIPPRKVLIIKPSAIGDVVHALPVLNLLRKKWPFAQISWLITPACAGLLEGHPQVDELIRFDRKGLGKSWKNLAAAKELHAFHLSLAKQEFDLVIDLQGLFRSGWLAWATKAPVRAGASDARELSPLFYTHIAKVERQSQHAVDRYLAVADMLGLGEAPVEFVFATDDLDRASVKEMLPTDEKYAVILPSTNWETKRWPVEHFAQLVQPLRDRFGFATVLAGAADAAAMAPQIPGAINVAGKTSLRQLTALLEKAELVIANDTGPMHIASALNRPLVTMYGPTDPVRTGPYGRMDSVVRVDIQCSPCFSRKCWHHSCMKWLGIVPVLEKADQQLGRHRQHLPVVN